LAGDAYVGKTNLVYKFIKNVNDKNDKNIAPTVGVEFSSKLVRLNGKNIKAQIWDTGTTAIT
jgi:GTPase SAR1 family protein